MDTKRYSVLHQRLMRFLQNSVGCRLFQNFIIKSEGGVVVDATQDGLLSCALFASGILRMATLGDETPLIDTVCLSNITLIDEGEGNHRLQNCGWVELNFEDWHELEPGTLVFWKKLYGARHCGFIMEQGKNPLAISNSSNNGMPVLHHPTFNGRRRIILAFWHHGFDAGWRPRR